MPNLPEDLLPAYSVPLPRGHSTADPLLTPTVVDSSPPPPSHRRAQEEAQPPPAAAASSSISGAGDPYEELPEGWIKQWDHNRNLAFFVDMLADPPRSIWTHPYEDPIFLRAVPDPQADSGSTLFSSSSPETEASRTAAAEMRARRIEQDRRTDATIASSLVRDYDFANGYHEDNFSRTRPPVSAVRYSSPSVSRAPSNPPLTPADIRARREAHDVRFSLVRYPTTFTTTHPPTFRPLQATRSLSSTPSITPEELRRRREEQDARSRPFRAPPPPNRVAYPASSQPSLPSFIPPNPQLPPTSIQGLSRYNSLPTTHRHAPVTGSSSIRRNLPPPPAPAHPPSGPPLPMVAQQQHQSLVSQESSQVQPESRFMRTLRGGEGTAMGYARGSGGGGGW